MEKTFGVKEEHIDYKKRIGVYALIDDGQNVGLVQVDRDFFLVGGGLEAGETHDA